MRIIAFANRNSGPCLHRIINPLMLMQDADVFITNNPIAEHFEKGCDLFMYNRTLSDQGWQLIKEFQKKYRFKICVDIDDYWHLDPHHVLYTLYEEEQFAKQQVEHLVDADVVLTTHSRLAEAIRLFNKNVHVIPNAIPKVGQFDIEREPHHLTRLFWQGSITHKEDINIIARPIEALGNISGKIKMIMGGYQEEPEWYAMARTYTAQLKHQYRLIPGVHVAKYYDMYRHADICLVPLMKSRFNSYKSNLKALEAANLGLPVIASHVDPYLDMPILYCKCGNDWIKHIKRLVESRKRQKEAGQELSEWADKHHNFLKINKERKQILEYEVKKQLT